MAEILHMKTRKIDVEQIHVYGCSMPAGDELTVPRDKDYVPLAGKELIACEKSDKRQAFPKTVGDHFGIPVINNAFWGASNEQSAYILLEDIMKQRIQRNHAVFFCITMLTRIMHFDKDDGHPMSLQLGQPDLLNKIADDETIVNHYNDFKMLYQYFTTMHQVMLLCKSIGAPLFFIPMYEHPTWNLMRDYRPYDSKLAKKPDRVRNEWKFRKIIDHIAREMNGISLCINPIRIATFFWYTDSLEEKDKKYYSAGGHPDKYAHDQYAQRLIELLTPEKAK